MHQFIKNNDVDYVHESISFLEDLLESNHVKDEELDVIGELLSNMYGAVEVHQSVKDGAEEKEALNGFMKRVIGSIDR